MGFYGKIYEQTGDVFNRVTFKNAASGDLSFNHSELKNFAIDATSHEDKLPFELGNRWLQFVEEEDAKGNQVCVIYHSAPQTVDSNAPTSLIGEIIRTEESDFFKLTNSESTLLTDEEKQALLDAGEQGNLIYFGDIIKIYSPVRDAAGHVVRYDDKEWKIGSIPRISDILTADDRIVNLENTVGIDGYPADKGTLAARTLGLEDDFENVRTIADDAAELASAAEASAEKAKEDADRARISAQNAEKSADDTAEDTKEFMDKATATLGRYDARISGNTNAIGAGDSDAIESELDTDSLLDWAQILIGVLGEDYNEIRYEDADTITEQIHNNDTDIAELQNDLAQEVTDRTAAVTNLTNYVNSKIQGVEETIEENQTANDEAFSTVYDDMAALGDNLEAQIISNDTDIATLQTNLNKEISDRDTAVTGERTRAIGIEEQLRADLTAETTRATGVEQGLDARLTEAEKNIVTNTNNINTNAQAIAKLNGNDTVVGSVAYLIHAETDARTSSEGVLRADINTLNSTLETLAALVEAQQSTILELQNKVADLESQLNPEPPETPPENDEGEEPIE